MVLLRNNVTDGQENDQVVDVEEKDGKQEILLEMNQQ
jgi:hypothetical protein